MTLAIIMLTLIAICLAASAVTSLLLYKRLTKTLIAVEHAAQRTADLSPKAARFLDEATLELSEIRGLTRSTGAVTANVQAITGELREGAEFLNLARRSNALVAGARAGFAALRQISNHPNGKGVHHEQQN
jgi:hypothetical protein